MTNFFKRFPPEDNEPDTEKINPAIQLYGRRFYKDQTPVEYLAEFLLVFASGKGDEQENLFKFFLGSGKARYWPKDGIALKLFSFFPSSKLETRHPVHQQEYTRALQLMKEAIKGTPSQKDEVVRLIQSLFSGFVGVARNRTWVTHSFLPASEALLSRELNWSHSSASKASDLKTWNDTQKYFQTSRYNFMARGGEVLFLQLAHLFSTTNEPLQAIQSDKAYAHLRFDLGDLKSDLEKGLHSLLSNTLGPVDGLAQFVETVLRDYRLESLPKEQSLGWVPSSTSPEAFLFASEMRNICASTLGPLEKLDLLQTLCCLQVLRSLCFQASRHDQSQSATDSFVGNYTWIAAAVDASTECGIRKLAQTSFDRIQDLLYRVLRIKAKESGQKDLREADRHGFEIFRKLAKQLGLVVPPTGRGQRFVLPAKMLRFMVAAVVAPGEKIRLTAFYSRVFAHYGIALGEQQLGIALAWLGNETVPRDYAVLADSSWIEEALQQGGFLVELSDAVSIVHNPGVEKQGV